MVSPLPRLVQLAYCSAARPFFSEADIRQILDVSRRQNPAHGITGVLLYKAGLVVQVLEGPPESVRTLFENIEKDPRHSDVHCLYDTPILEREFPQWSMGFRYLEFGYEQPPESFNQMLSQFTKLQSASLRRGTSLLVNFASTTR